MELTAAQIKRIEQKRRDEQLFRDGKIKKRPPSWEELNKELGYPAKSGEILRKWYCDRFVRKRVASYVPPDIVDSTEECCSSIVLDSNCDFDHNPEKLLILHGYDPAVWEITSSRSSKLASGKISSSIYVKPKTGSFAINIDEVIRRCLQYAPPETGINEHKKPTYPYADDADKYMLEIGIVDLHLGKRFFEGGGSHETALTYNYAIDNFINRTRGYNIEEIVLTIGNDFFNFDGISGSTTKGTPQSNDMSWTSVFECGVTMVIDAIKKLSEIANVHVVYVPSNHDRQAGWYMAKVIEAKYAGSDRVSVDASAKPRKYKQYGNNMLVFWHGEGDMKRILQAIPIEAPEMFTSTRFRELHTGHVHHISDNESGGITQRALPTFTRPDDWHMEQGYVCTLPRTSAYLWNKNYGLEEILYVNF